MIIRLKSNSFLPRWIRVQAIVLYPYILFAKEVSLDILAHELVHIDQIQRKGFIIFYYTYLAEYLKLRLKGAGHSEAYFNISYEKEAYQLAHRPEHYYAQAEKIYQSTFSIG